MAPATLNLNTKLVLLGVMLLVPLLLVAGSAVAYLSVISQSTDLLGRVSMNHHLIMEAQLGLSHLTQQVLRGVSTPSQRAACLKETDVVSALLSDLAAAERDEAGSLTLAGIRRALAAVRRDFSSGTAGERGTEAAMSSRVEGIVNALKQYHDRSFHYMHQAVTQSARDSRRVLLTFGIAALSLIVLAAGSAILIGRSILGPIRAFRHASQAVAEGQFDRRIALNSTDELGLAARDFNRMAERLQQFYRELETKVQTSEASASQEQRRAEEARALVSMLSHQLRLPAVTILQQATLALDNLERPAEVRQHLAAMRDEAEALDATLARLLQLAKIQAGHVEVRALPLPVPWLLNRLQQRFPAARISPPPDALDIWGDYEFAMQILSNLMDNAAKYADGGAVEVSACQCGEQVRIVVEDRGAGIPPEDLPSVFDAFFRGGNVADRPGTGLGLSIARSLAELQGGKLSAEHRLGGGSRFILSLPVPPVSS